jgi:hypothetical protein
MLRAAYPTVARLVQAKTFPDVAADERRDLLRAALLLGSDRAEPMLVDIVKKGGVLLNEARESTRATAAEVLGELSRSRVTASALQDVAQSRWGVSDETKMASANAAKLILARASGIGGAP